ncbi:MAG: hypothetical protein D6722_23180 [Bacteroidetes bacterium]|nr:MAG: hypothetical protein D6722_23180 [Bacteroidota bacterium]
MKTSRFLAALALMGWASLMEACDSPPPAAEAAAPLTAQAVIDHAIAAHGGAAYDTVAVQFRFRDRRYRLRRDHGRYQYERLFVQAGDSLRDVLTNETFTRYRQGAVEPLSDSLAGLYRNSVNSVAYFALLPYGLNDPAVIKEYLGQETLDSTAYHKIRVTFRQEGGGEDFEDVFIYWIHPDSWQMDYLAYRYHTDGGGLRFRSVIRTQEVAGIRFQDYANYKGDPDRLALEDSGKAFVRDSLTLLSRIELEALQALP